MQSQKIYFWDQSYMLICIIYCVIFRRNFSMFNEDNRATYENILAEFLFLKFEVSKNIHFRGLRHCIHLISQPLKQNYFFIFISIFSNWFDSFFYGTGSFNPLVRPSFNGPYKISISFFYQHIVFRIWNNDISHA